MIVNDKLSINAIKFNGKIVEWGRVGSGFQGWTVA